MDVCTLDSKYVTKSWKLKLGVTVKAGIKDEIGFAGGSVTLTLGKFQWGFSLLEGTVQYNSLLCRRCGPGKNQLYTASPIQMSFNHSF